MQKSREEWIKEFVEGAGATEAEANVALDVLIELVLASHNNQRNLTLISEEGEIAVIPKEEKEYWESLRAQ